MNTIRIHRTLLATVVAASGLMLGHSSTALAAGTATSNMDVSADVGSNCTISAGALAFGTYDPVVTNASSGSDLTSSATLTVTCTTGSANKITMGQGLHADAASTAAVPLRQMVSGANKMAYSLFQEVGLSTVWGDTALTGVAYTGTGTSGSVTVYGAVAKGQNLPFGSYADTVVATITF